MDILEAIQMRHSVRAYKADAIPKEIREELDDLVASCNGESGLSIRIIYDDPDGFDSRLARYGKFSNVRNYIMLVGDKDHDIDEACGYYGEKIVLEAQMLGLNTCWVAMTYNKKKVKELLLPDEKLCMVIALGYGKDPGVPRKSKLPEQVVVTKGQMPDWFRAGVDAALLAPTAVNQQKFVIGVKNGLPVIKVRGRGFHTKVDLGIVKYHFEMASGYVVKG